MNTDLVIGLVGFAVVLAGCAVAVRRDVVRRRRAARTRRQAALAQYFRARRTGLDVRDAVGEPARWTA